MVGLLHIAAIGLLVAGALKIHDPAPTRRALAVVGLSTGAMGIGVLALVEIAVAVSVLVAGGAQPAVALAILYGGFGGFITVALRRNGTDARCGCFGASDAPPTVLHAVLNGSIAATAATLAMTSAPSLLEVAGQHPGQGVVYIALLVSGAAALYLTMDRLPRLDAAMKDSAGPAR